MRALLLVLSVLPAANVIAGNNTWTSLGPQGGTVYDLAFHPSTPSTMYAATPDGFYRSTDGGITWQETAPANPTFYFRPVAIAVHSGNTDYVHVASSGGHAIRSDDRGVGFHRTLQNLAADTPSFAIAASRDGAAIYYALGSNVYRSTDQGVTRQLRGSFAPSTALINTLRVHPSDPQIVYSSTFFAGLFRSTDGGASWHALYVPPPGLIRGVWTFAIDPTDASRIWLGEDQAIRVSLDGGATWSVAVAETATDIDVDAIDPAIVYASLQDGRVLRTGDGGSTWTALPVPQRARVGGTPRLAIHPTVSSTLYLFGTTGVFVSTDSGATWQRADGGIFATSPRAFAAIHEPTGRVYFPIAEYGIGSIGPAATAVDVLLSPPLSTAAGQHPPNVTALVSTSGQPVGLVAVFDQQKIAFSTNAGSQWTLASAPPTAVQITSLVRGGSTLYAATSSGVYRSLDNGDRWTESSTGVPPDAAVASIAVTANPSVLFAAMRTLPNVIDEIYKSSDGGITWAPTSGRLQKRLVSMLVPHPQDAQTLIVGTNEGAFRTRDGGATWETLGLFPGGTGSPVSAIVIDPSDPRIIYIDGPGPIGNMVRSVDAGATFQRMMPDYYKSPGAHSLAVIPANPNNLLAALAGGGVKELTVAPDLEVSIASPAGTPLANRPTEFTITVRNRGPFDATAVRLEAQLPDAMTGLAATTSAGNCVVALALTTCTADIVRRDASVTVRVTATPTAAGAFRLNASVSAAQPDVVTGNNAATGSTSIALSQPSGGGGGGGAGSLLLLLLLVLAAQRQRFGRSTKSFETRAPLEIHQRTARACDRTMS